MVDMGVRHHHRIDVLRIDAGLLERAHELAGRRAEDLQAAHAGVEEHEPVAGVEHQHVLLEDGVVDRQEVLVELAVHLLLAQPGEVGVRVAERQRAVRHDRRLGAAELETIEIRRRGVEQRRLAESAIERADRQRAGGGRSGKQVAARNEKIDLGHVGHSPMDGVGRNSISVLACRRPDNERNAD
jgi:hypothetical protein